MPRVFGQDLINIPPFAKPRPIARAGNRPGRDRVQCQAGQHGWRRQKLWTWRLRRRLVAARPTERYELSLGNRRRRHPPSRLSPRHDQPQADRRGVRRDQDRGGPCKARHRGRSLVGWFLVLTSTAYNLVRIRSIPAATGWIPLEHQIWRYPTSRHAPRIASRSADARTHRLKSPSKTHFRHRCRPDRRRFDQASHESRLRRLARSGGRDRPEWATRFLPQFKAVVETR